MSCRPFFLTLALASFASLQAAAPHLVKPLNLRPAPVTLPGNILGSTGTTAYFAVKNARWELWKTDGTPEGTQRVVELPDGVSIDVDGGAAAAGQRLIFKGEDAAHGKEPWVTDGTAAGTHLLSDIATGATGSDVEQLRGLGAEGWFTATTAETGRELWRSDGTPEGTKLAADLVSGPATSNPVILGSAGTRVFATRSDSAVVAIASDGSVTQLANVNAGRGVAIGDRFIFSTFMPSPIGFTLPWSLYVTDGTAAGTKVLRASLLTGAGLSPSLVADGSYVWFNADDGTSGDELWRTDGTAAGTAIYFDAASHPTGATKAHQITLVGGKLFFFGQFGSDTNLYTAGPGRAFTLVRSQIDSPGPTYAVNGRLLFAFRETSSRTVWWSSDGTLEGTAKVANPVAPIATVVNDRFLFRAVDAEHGTETWTSDGTAAGTRLLVNAGFAPTTGSQPQTLTPFGNGILFVAYDGFEWGLWSSDGSEAHTVRLSRLSHPISVSAVSNGIFWFKQNTKELWRSDGTAAGTYRTPFSPMGSIDDLLPYRNGVAVADRRFESTVRLWFTTDGTPAGTAQFNIGPDQLTGSIAVSGDFVYFGSGQPGGRKVVMRTDGTWPGTKVAAELPSNALPIDVTASGNLIYVTSGGSNAALDLWRIDPDQSVPIRLGGFNDATIFRKAFGASRFAAAGFEANVWISDGTPAGTFVATSAFAGAGFTVGGSNIYWLSTKRLWISDGTRVGTRTVSLDDDPAIQDVCYCASAVWVDGHLYFRHASTAAGTELWITDATAAGTHLLADVNPGPASSMPANFVQSGSTLFFTAHNASYGEELWALPLGPRRRAAAQ